MSPACRRRCPASPLLVLARALLSAPGGTAHLGRVCFSLAEADVVVVYNKDGSYTMQVSADPSSLKPLQAKPPTSNNRLMFYLIWGENLHISH